MSKINNFGSHIPEATLIGNDELNRLVNIFDGMLKVEENELDTYMRTFIYPAVTDIRMMRRYVDEWSAEYTDKSTKFCIDCLYSNYYNIYSKKGTFDGLKQLLKCLCETNNQVIIDSFKMWKPLILSDDDRVYDWLPEGQDIANEVTVPVGSEIWCPTLLDDTWDDSKEELIITIDVDYTPSIDFIRFLKELIPKYVPMVSEGFINITLNFI